MNKLNESDNTNQTPWKKQIIKPVILGGNKDLKIIIECFVPFMIIYLTPKEANKNHKSVKYFERWVQNMLQI